MLFKIRVRLSCGSKFLELWTDSIKVVAKLDSIRKKQAEREGVTVPGRKNKRARSDDLLDSLASIQEQQRMNSSEHCTITSPVSPSYSPVIPNSPTSSPPRLSVSANGTDSLETAFYQFLQVYSQVESDERPKKMRRIMENLDTDKKKEVKDIGCVLADFTDAHSSEESVTEQETFTYHSSSLSASSDASSELRSYLVGDDLELSNEQFNSSQMSSEDLESWNSIPKTF